MTTPLFHYTDLLASVKQRIRQGQARAVLAANAELIALYWDVGRMIHERQRQEGWGAGVIPRLARDIRNELPEVKGFSERNIGRMIAFYRTYSEDTEFLPQPVAKIETPEKVPQPVAQMDFRAILQRLAAKIPWGHNILLLEKVKDLSARLWYMQQVVEHGYARETLTSMIKSRAHERHGKTVSNFSDRLPSDQSALVVQALKDPYIFDFLTLEEPFHERELETELVRHLENFCWNWGRALPLWGGSIVWRWARRITTLTCSSTT